MSAPRSDVARVRANKLPNSTIVDANHDGDYHLRAVFSMRVSLFSLLSLLATRL